MKTSSRLPTPPLGRLLAILGVGAMLATQCKLPLAPHHGHCDEHQTAASPHSGHSDGSLSSSVPAPTQQTLRSGCILCFSSSVPRGPTSMAESPVSLLAASMVLAARSQEGSALPNAANVSTPFPRGPPLLGAMPSAS